MTAKKFPLTFGRKTLKTRLKYQIGILPFNQLFFSFVPCESVEIILKNDNLSTNKAAKIVYSKIYVCKQIFIP